jgi:hypothetical protein
MALEFNIITSREFFRLGTHGELDWPVSMGVLEALGENLIGRGIDRAMLDLRDAQTNLNNEQVQDLVRVLKRAGFRGHHRIAILRRAHPRAGEFVMAARLKGFDFGVFMSYEEAAEWLSASEEEDPEFDRDTFKDPDEKEQGGGGAGS